MEHLNLISKLEDPSTNSIVNKINEIIDECNLISRPVIIRMIVKEGISTIECRSYARQLHKYLEEQKIPSVVILEREKGSPRFEIYNCKSLEINYEDLHSDAMTFDDIRKLIESY